MRNRSKLDSDLVVIGAGMCGASAARHAAEAGKRVFLLDADAIGSGMTGKSAGHVMTGFLPSPSAMTDLLGSVAALRLQNWAHESKLLLRRRWTLLGLASTITNGYILTGSNKEDCDLLRDSSDYWRTELGLKDVRLFSKDDVKQHIHSPVVACALFDPSGFIIDPDAINLGLRRLVSHPNITIREHVTITNIEECNSGYEVHFRAGHLLCEEVFVAVGAFPIDFLPGYISPVVPSFTVSGLTGPLSQAKLEYLHPSKIAGGSDCSVEPNYWTIMRDGRLMFGFGHFKSPFGSRSLEELVRKQALHLFPHIQDPNFQSCSISAIDSTPSGLPSLISIGPKMKVAIGFSGLGLAAGYGAGRLVGVPWEVV